MLQVPVFLNQTVSRVANGSEQSVDYAEKSQAAMESYGL